MIRALVLGGNGFIGSHLVDELIKQGHSVRVFDKYKEPYRKPLDSVDYVFGEFGNRGLIEDALANIDVVFHLICTTLPKTSNDDPSFDVQTNVIDTLALLDLCVENKISKFVYVSSGGTVYGVPATLPISEDSANSPLCSYGITKLCVEKYLEMFHYVHGLDYVVLRPSNPFGPRQNPDNIQGAISVFLGNLAQKRTITIWGDGSIVRDYIYVQDLVKGIYRASVTPASHRVFNMGSGTGVSLRQLITIIDEVTGCKSNVEYMPKRTFDIPEIYLDIGRAKDELGWQPTTRLQDGIIHTWEFVKTVF